MRKEMRRRSKNEIKSRVIGLCYPPRCPGCDAILLTKDRALGFCGECRKKIVVVKERFCMKCGKQLPDSREEYCEDCGRAEHAFVEGRAVFGYEGVMKAAMYRFKYGNRRGYAGIFAAWAVRAHGSWIREKQPDVIVPVPLYFRKRQQRGYNQALVWGAALGEKLNLAVDGRALFRVRPTRPQKELDPVGRSVNLERAFFARREPVAGKTVFLVDDIYTTGSTMDEAAETLLEAGAARVFALSICTGR